MTIFCSWSGGKESSLALDRVVREGYEVDCLITMLPSRGSMVGHGLPPKFYSMQAESMDIQMKKKETDWEGYGERFSELIRSVRPDKGIFGDVYLSEHKEWVEGKAEELGFEALEPLWGEDPEEIYLEYLDRGFEGIVVKVTPEEVSPDWLGRFLDEDFLNYLKGNGICPLGERGEFHVATLDGPPFDREIEVEVGGERKHGDRLVIELEDYRLV